MLTPPSDVNAGDLLRSLGSWFGGVDGEARFVPVGEDSWCYACGDLWVSLRRDLRGHVPEAYEAAAELAGALGSRVVAPLRGRDGEVVQRFGVHPVVAFERLPLESFADRSPSEAEIAEAVDVVRSVHATTVATALPRESFELPFEADLELAARLPDEPPGALGPLSADLVDLLAANAEHVAGLRAEWRSLAHRAQQTDCALVVTHGEPIRSNVCRTPSGIALIDWGEVALAPMERDAAHLRRTLGAQMGGEPWLLRLYDVRWALSEIAEYVAVLARDHRGDADDHAMWDRLLRYLPHEHPTKERRS